jgi:hypothetical protein
MFSVGDLENLMCGTQDEVWEIKQLKEAIIPDHGYNKKSRAYHELIAEICKFNTHEKRSFL